MLLRIPPLVPSTPEGLYLLVPGRAHAHAGDLVLPFSTVIDLSIVGKLQAFLPRTSTSLATYQGLHCTPYLHPKMLSPGTGSEAVLHCVPGLVLHARPVSIRQGTFTLSWLLCHPLRQSPGKPGDQSSSSSSSSFSSSASREARLLRFIASSCFSLISLRICSRFSLR